MSSNGVICARVFYLLGQNRPVNKHLSQIFLCTLKNIEFLSSNLKKNFFLSPISEIPSLFESFSMGPIQDNQFEQFFSIINLKNFSFFTNQDFIILLQRKSSESQLKFK